MITFTAPGPPVPKERARILKRRTFTPGKTKAFESSVAAYARIAMREAGVEMVGKRIPVSLSLEFYMPDRRRRDIDNMAKAVMDGLNGVLYHDDYQVVRLECVKSVDKDDPRTVVTMTILEEI